MTVKERLIARIEAMTEEDAGELVRIAEEVEADRRQGVGRLSAEEVERELGLR